MGIQSRRKKSRPRVGVGLTRWAARLPAEALEPTRSCDHWILSPARLPIPPRRREKCEATKSKAKLKRFRCVESGRVSRNPIAPDYMSLPRLELDCWLPISEVPTFRFSR